MIKKTFFSILAVLISAFGWVNVTWGVGCSDTDSNYTFGFGSSTSCANFSPNVYSCLISSGSNHCSFTTGTGTFQIQITSGAVGGNLPISWEIIRTAGDPGLPIEQPDLALLSLNGSNAVNGCGFAYTQGQLEDTNLEYIKPNNTIAGTSSLEFCFNGENITITPQVETPACPPGIQIAVDADPGILAATIIEEDPDFGSKVTFCERSDAETTHCLNNPGVNADPGPTGLSDCDEGPKGRPDTVITGTGAAPSVNALGLGSSCALVCVPPPMTLGGSSSCEWVCLPEEL